MTRLWRRILGVVIVLALALAALHLPPVRERVLGLVLRRIAAASGLAIRADRLDYRLLDLDFRFAGLVLGVPGRPPLLEARSVRLHLGPRVLIGGLAIRELSASGLRVSVVREKDGSSNFPRSKPRVGARPISPLVVLRRLDLRDADVLLDDRASGLRVQGAGLALEMQGGEAGAQGQLSAGAPLAWRFGEREGRIVLKPLPLRYDGRDLSLDGLSLEGEDARLDLRGRVRDVHGAGTLELSVKGRADPSRLPLATSPLKGRLDFAGRLAGSLGAPTAELAVSGPDLAIGPLAHLALETRGSVDGTGVTIDSGRLRVARGTVDVSGRVAFEERSASRLEARWDGIELALLDRRLGNRLAGEARASWRGASGAGLELAATARAQAGEGTEGLQLEGRADVAVQKGTWSLTADLGHPGVLHLAGTAGGSFVEAEPRASSLAGDLSLESEDLGSLSRALPTLGLPASHGACRLDATLGGTLGRPHAEGTARVADLRLPALLRAPIELEAGFVAGDTGVQIRGLEGRAASATLTGEGSLHSRDLALQGRFSMAASDLAALQLALPAGVEPGGTLRGEGTIEGSLDVPDVRLTLAGSDLRMAGQAFRSLKAVAEIDGDALQLQSLELAQEAGNLSLSASSTARGLELHARAQGLELAPLPAALVGGAEPLALAGRLQLELDVAGSRTAPEGGGRFAVESASVVGRALGPVRGTLAAKGGIVSADLAAPEVWLSASGQADLASPHAFDARARLEGADLAALAARAGIDAPDLRGSASAEARMRGRLQPAAIDATELNVASLDGSYRGTPLRLVAPGRVVRDASGLRVFGLAFAVGRSQVSWQGSLDGGQSLRTVIDADLADASPWLRGTASGRVRGTITTGGTVGRPIFEGELSVEGARFVVPGKPPVRDLEARATLHGGVLELASLEGTWSGAHVRASGQVTERFLAALLPTGFRDRASGPPAAASLTASVVGNADRWLAPFLDDDQPFETRGRDTTLTLELQSVAPRLDALRGQATVTALDATLTDVPLTQEGTARLSFEGGRATLTDARWTGPDTELSVRGEVQLPGDLQRLQAEGELAVEGKADLRVLQSLTRGVQTGGFGTFAVTAKGPLGAPRLAGEIQFKDGLLRYRPVRLAFDALEGRLRFGPEGVAVEGVTGMLNGGVLTVEGSLPPGAEGAPPAPPGSAAGGLHLRARGAMLEWPRGLRSSVGANLTLHRAGGDFELSGNVVVREGAYRTTDYFSLQLMQLVERLSAGETPPAWTGRLRLDVGFRSAQDLLLQAVDGTLQIAADLRLGGTAAVPVVSGKITAAPGGRVFMGGRTYDVDSAVLDFTRGAGLEPYVLVRAETRVSQYTVQAEVTGPATRFQTRFVSDPPLSDRDIVSLLTSGRTLAGQGSAGQADALSLASGGMLGKTGNMLGFDTVRIESSGQRDFLDFDPTAVSSQANPASRLTFSKRLAQNVAVTFSQSLATAGNLTWFVSWKPRPPFEIRVAQRDDRSGALEFRHDVSFGAAPPPVRPRARRRTRGEETVKETRVLVDGAPAPELQSGLRLRAGSRFDYERWLDDRDHLAERLAQQGFFEARVLAHRDPPAPERGAPVTLEYEIRKGWPTEIVFSGLPAPASLRERIERAWYLSEYGSSIDDEAEALTRDYLFDEGYLTPRVRARTRVPRGTQTKRLRVTVETGRKTRFHAVAFEGNALVPTSRLEAVVKGREKAAWLQRDALRQSVLDVYKGEGLLGAAVTVAPPRIEDDTATLPVVIDEGPQLTLGEVTAEGASGLAPETVLERAGLVPGRIYKPAEITAARDKVIEAYRAEGWNQVSVRIEGKFDPASPTVSARITVIEGPRQVLAEVTFDGGSPGSRARAERKLELGPGQPVNLNQWADARKRLYDSGYYKGVDIQPEPLPSPAEDGQEDVRARVRLEEWPALRLRYGLQLVTSGSLASEEARRNLRPGIVAELTRRTLLGLPLSSGLAAQARKDYQQARAFFSLPRTFDTPLRSSLFLTGTHQTDFFDPDIDRQGDFRSVELTVEERLRAWSKVEFASSYNLQWSHLDPAVPVPDLNPDLTLARLINTALLDGRNDLIDTTRGYFSSANYEFGSPGLGSDLPIRKLLLQQFVYVPVRRVVLASAARFERARGRGTAYYPDDRLLAGGANTVRGYSEDSLRPAPVNLVGGSTMLVVLNQELRFPILGPVRGVVFGDGAILITHLEDRKTEDSHLSTGFGLRYVTPVGILRLDFGIPLDQGFKPARGRLYFSLGQIF
jgi:outer membrane protein assembly factor BamA